MAPGSRSSLVSGGQLAVLQLLALGQRERGAARGQLRRRLPHRSHRE